MIKGRKDLRFSPESGESVGVGRKRVRQNLQSIVPPELGMVRPPDLAHSAFAKQGDDFIRPEANTGGQHHAPEFYDRKGGTLR